MVVLRDPAEDPDDILRANRSREKQYVFDKAFDGGASQVRLSAPNAEPLFLPHLQQIHYCIQI